MINTKLPSMCHSSQGLPNDANRNTYIFLLETAFPHLYNWLRLQAGWLECMVKWAFWSAFMMVVGHWPSLGLLYPWSFGSSSLRIGVVRKPVWPVMKVPSAAPPCLAPKIWDSETWFRRKRKYRCLSAVYHGQAVMMPVM
jgi:hypothetical protein